MHTLKLTAGQAVVLLTHIHDQEVAKNYDHFANELYLIAKRIAIGYTLTQEYEFNISPLLLEMLDNEVKSIKQLPLATPELVLVENIYIRLGYARNTKD